MAKESDSRKSGSLSSLNLLTTQRPFSRLRTQTSGASPYVLAPGAWDVSLGARSEERELFSRATLGPLANACNANKICGGQYELGAPRRELVHRGSLAGRITKCTKHRKD